MVDYYNIQVFFDDKPKLNIICKDFERKDNFMVFSSVIEEGTFVDAMTINTDKTNRIAVIKMNGGLNKSIGEYFEIVMGNTVIRFKNSIEKSLESLKEE